ncbi:MAG TPA: alpha/beta fold hydrolase [Methylomirabilota bacterium]|nr:alpha/beta fold hydrolase [Methylomirabilota bacterium]
MPEASGIRAHRSAWLPSLAALFLLLGAPAAAQPTYAELGCSQEPGNRFYWIERAFCDLEMAGPDRANGIIIWNHGISGTNPSWRAPAPPAFRLLQARGWDVIMLKRHHLAETMPGGPLNRSVERTQQEAAAQRKFGYRKVVLAGQSFGGYVTLEAIDTSPGVFAAIALAPGVRPRGADGRFDATTVEQILQHARVGRLALVFPKNDALFGDNARGERAQPILARRELPYLMIDETSEITGHGGGASGRFALRYGLCLAEFLAAATLPAGRFSCPTPGDDWQVVRELLMRPGEEAPSLAVDPSTLPAALVSLIGLRWALLGDSLVLVAPVADPRGVRLLYRSSGSPGGVYEPKIAGDSIQAVLPNKSTVVLSPAGGGTITWTSSDRSVVLKAPLRRGAER